MIVFMYLRHISESIIEIPGIGIFDIVSGFSVKNGPVSLDLFGHFKYVIRIKIVTHGIVGLSFRLEGSL